MNMEGPNLNFARIGWRNFSIDRRRFVGRIFLRKEVLKFDTDLVSIILNPASSSFLLIMSGWKFKKGIVPFFFDRFVLRSLGKISRLKVKFPWRSSKT